jgi:hypothetical protein
MPATDINDEGKRNAIKLVLGRGVTSCIVTSHLLHFLKHITTMRDSDCGFMILGTM